MEEKAKKKKILIGAVVGVVAIVVIVLAIIVIGNGSFGNLSSKDAETKVTKFINEELLSGQGTATVKMLGVENGLYKLEITYNGQKIDSYLTKDGKKFFPQAMDLTPATATPSTASSAETKPAAAADLPKTDKPVVEAFVMSYCPYGTQIEKGLLPVAQLLGNKIDFKIKFVSYTMHGDKEQTENTRQFCIQDEQTSKYFPYLNCFLAKGDADSCLKDAGIDTGKLNSCMSATAKKNNLTAGSTDYPIQKAENEKYNVQGSPTLVINGTQADSGRDSASLLKTICAAFKTAPAECQKTLSSDTPASGFGSGTDSSGSGSAGCATQ